jgi:hypothetical protein
LSLSAWPPALKKRKGHIDSTSCAAVFSAGAALTTSCRRSTSSVTGVPRPANGSVVSHNSSPVSLSNARNLRSKLVADVLRLVHGENEHRRGREGRK